MNERKVAREETKQLPTKTQVDVELLGSKLRKARQDQGLTISALAEASGVSRAFVSQVENGQVNCSISSISNLAAAVGLNLAELFLPEPTSSEGLVPADQRVRMVLRHGKHFEEILSPSLEGQLLVLAAEIAPGVTSNRRYWPSIEEGCVFLQAGTLMFKLEGERFHLTPGDSLTFDGARSYSWANYGSETVRAVWILTLKR